MDEIEHSPLKGFSGGTQWCVDASGCDSQLLQDLDGIESVCRSVIRDLGLSVVGTPQQHKFPQPGGVTFLYLLSESHLACHTYPEFEFATFNLYCCRDRKTWDWEGELRKRIGAQSVMIRRVDRSITPSCLELDA